MRHIVTPAWVAEGYEFPADVMVTLADDLANLKDVELGSADFVVLPYDGSSIDDATLISKMKQVSVIQTLTAGFNSLEHLIPQGVTLCNVSGVHDVATSEMAVLLTLNALRDFPRIQKAHERHEWDQFYGQSLLNKSVLLVGYGDVGKAIHRRLEGFECQVMPVASHARDAVRGIDELDELLPGADVIILAVPLNASTENLIDSRRLGLLKDGALFVSVARGRVVDQDALLRELNAGRLRAAVDVTTPEPLPADHQMWSTPNLIIAPHIGADTDALTPRARMRIHRQWDLWLAGKPLECVVVQ